MKKSAIILFLLLPLHCLYGQTCNLTLIFSGFDQNAMSNVALQKVEIHNITRGVDTAIYSSPFQIMLNWQLGVSETHVETENLSSSPVFPNPFSSSSAFDFKLKRKSKIKAILYGIDGKLLDHEELVCVPGNHRFKVHGGTQGILFVRLSDGESSQTLKLVSLGNGTSGQSKLSYEGFDPFQGPGNRRQYNDPFRFFPGDQLLIIGYANGYFNHPITDSPGSDSAYVFNFVPVMGISCPGLPTITDFDGNVYGTVLIGSQCWMKENLKAGHYANGTAIPLVTGNSDWEALGHSERGYCYHNNSVSTANVYGALYTWAAATNGLLPASGNSSQVQGVCPAGWRVPADDDWKQLEMFLGMTQEQADGEGWRGTNQGGQLKSLDFWSSPNAGALGLTGFSALPGGSRLNIGFFDNLGINGDWWTASEAGFSTAPWRKLVYHYPQIYRGLSNKDYGRSVRCLYNGSPAQTPIVITSAVSGIGLSTAISGGEIASFGMEAITGRGVCWSTSPNPTISDYSTSEGLGSGSFLSVLTGLIPATSYHIRAYATSSDGTTYGNELVFTTQAPPAFVCGDSTLSDFDGNVYQTVLIGSQCWMRENLKVSHYSDGTAIPNLMSDLDWNAMDSTGKAFCFYDNSPANGAAYGALYTWAAAMNGSGSGSSGSDGVQGVCPTGWHVPGDHEWKQLELNLGMSQDQADSAGWRGQNQGGRLKDTILWAAPNAGATNSSGFSALPGGLRHPNVSFVLLGEYGTWWSASGNISSEVWGRGLYFGLSQVERSSSSMNLGFSVRCLWDSLGPLLSPPSVATSPVSSITAVSAISGGEAFSDGGAAIAARGVCWNTSGNPTIVDNSTSNGTGTGVFSSNLSGLSPNTGYFVRAYASNSLGISYGNQIPFYTPPNLPVITTAPVSFISSNSAICGGEVLSDGGAVTARGVCWDTAPNPSLAGFHTADGTGLGTFSSSLTGLSPNINYFVKAYATNSQGTVYGNQVQFSTPADPPVIGPSSVFCITDVSATYSGEIISDGGATITARGVCWNISGNPDLADNHTLDGTGPGVFSSTLTGLSPNTVVFLRTYATNNQSTVYGNQVQFSTLDQIPFSCGSSTISDCNGNVYNTVQIGSQCWLKENLKATLFPDGTPVPFVSGNSAWNELSSSSKAYCYYNNSASNGAIYGLLYTWAAAMNGVAPDSSNSGGVQGVCPSGWHLPGDLEWKQMEIFLGMTQAQADGTHFRGTDQGGQLKATSLWANPNTGASNTSGFTALPAGYRSGNGSYISLGSNGNWWTSTETISSHAMKRTLAYDNAQIYRYPDFRNFGFSVRCLRDN